MNIEEAKITLNWQLELADKENKEILNLFDKEAIRTLLTAYEEKGEKCDFLDKELYNANQEIQKLQINIQKEKEKNKELNRLKGFEMLDIFNMGKQSSRQRIEFDYVDKEKIKAKVIEIKDRAVKDEFITASQGKLNTIIDIESLLD